MRTFQVEVEWVMKNTMEVKAQDAEDAAQKAHDKAELPNGEYVGDSFCVLRVSLIAEQN